MVRPFVSQQEDKKRHIYPTRRGHKKKTFDNNDKKVGNSKRENPVNKGYTGFLDMS